MWQSIELHGHRGHRSSATGFIMGRELTGKVIKVGSSVQKFKPGELVVVPLTVTCGSCFYCERGISSRCVNSQLFGSSVLDSG
ncbi:hypothetical protein CBS147353_10663 [Aspergillus niger]|nr:hypothetical protein CBS147353_10663 [Aspergillus niger]